MVFILPSFGRRPQMEANFTDRYGKEHYQIGNIDDLHYQALQLERNIIEQKDDLPDGVMRNKFRESFEAINEAYQDMSSPQAEILGTLSDENRRKLQEVQMILSRVSSRAGIEQEIENEAQDTI